MKQIQFALEDLWKRKWLSLLLWLQCILLLFIANFIIENIKDLSNMKQEVNRLTKSEPIYYFYDLTTEKQLDQTLNQPKHLDDYKAIYKKIYEKKDSRAFSLYTTTYPFDLQYFEPNLRDVIVEGHQVYIDVLPFANASFYDFAQLKLSQGRYFHQDEIQTTKQPIPVVIGSGLAASLQVGSEFTSDEEHYRVIGILEENMSYINLAASKDFISLDYAILLPTPILEDNTDYYALLSGTMIPTSNEQGIRDTMAFIQNQGHVSFVYRDLSKQMPYVMEDKKKWIQMQLMLTILISIFTLISITVSYLQFIRKYTFELGVHILTGATKNQIIFRLCSQLIILFALANSVVFMILHRFQISIMMTVISCMILWIVPIIRIRKMKIDQMLRRKS